MTTSLKDFFKSISVANNDLIKKVLRANDAPTYQNTEISSTVELDGLKADAHVSFNYYGVNEGSYLVIKFSEQQKPFLNISINTQPERETETTIIASQLDYESYFEEVASMQDLIKKMNLQKEIIQVFSEETKNITNFLEQL